MSKSFEEKDLLVIVCEAINLNVDNDRIIELISKLDSRSLSDDLYGNQTILFKIIRKHNLELLEYLLHCTDIDVNRCLLMEATIHYALKVAIDCNFFEGFELLVNHPSTNINNLENIYPVISRISYLEFNTSKKYLEVFLTRNDVNINADRRGETALMNFLGDGNVDCAKMILEYPYKNVAFTKVDAMGHDIMWYAEQGGEECVNLLKEHAGHMFEIE